MSHASPYLPLPARVYRYPGALDALGALCRPVGKTVWVIGGRTALAHSRERIEASLAEAGLVLAGVEEFVGECEIETVDALAHRVRALGADVIIAVGGGKALDTGKSTAARAALPVVTVPTIAATCAAVTAVCARYRPDGSFLEIEHLADAPLAVVIDSALIARSPVRWLAAGLGDTLAKWYEFRAICGDTPGESRALAAAANSRICYDLIVKHGAAARQALENATSTAALESALDAIFIFAGLTSILGTGAHAAAAHGIFEGFTALRKTRQFGHGLLVGYGNLCLLALEKRPLAEIQEAIDLARRCAIPVSLAQIAALDADDIRQVACASAVAADMGNMPFPVTALDIETAMRDIDRLAIG